MGEFYLVDDDILLPENLVRNDLDWREVALHKVDALADKVEYVQPGTLCKRYRRSLGWIFNSLRGLTVYSFNV